MLQPVGVSQFHIITLGCRFFLSYSSAILQDTTPFSTWPQFCESIVSAPRKWKGTWKNIKSKYEVPDSEVIHFTSVQFHHQKRNFKENWQPSALLQNILLRRIGKQNLEGTWQICAKYQIKGRTWGINLLKSSGCLVYF